MAMKRRSLLRIYGVFITVSVSFSFAVLSDVDYVVYKSNACYSDTQLLTSTTGIPLSTCVVECIGRQRCAGVSHKRGVHICDLLSTIQGEVINGPCDIVRRADIVLKALSCSSCTPEQACDLSSGACAAKECTFPVIVNRTYLGNRNSVGHRLGVMCDRGYSREAHTKKYITCGTDGQWSPIPDCVLDLQVSGAQPFQAIDAWQSSLHVYDGVSMNAGFAIDGDSQNTDVFRCAHTSRGLSNWACEFSGPRLVSSVKVYFWNELHYASRNRDMEFLVSSTRADSDANIGTVCATYGGPPSDISQPIQVTCDEPVVGRFLKIQHQYNGHLVLCEVIVL